LLAARPPLTGTSISAASKIDHVSIQVADLQRSAECDQKMFDFSGISAFRNHFASAWTLSSLHRQSPAGIVDHFAIGPRFSKQSAAPILKRNGNPEDASYAGLHIKEPGRDQRADLFFTDDRADPFSQMIKSNSAKTAAILTRREAMTLKAVTLTIFACLTVTGAAFAQDLGPRVKKLADGVYVHTGKGFDSNSGIILTEEGVVVIDTGQNPIESRDIMDTIKKLTSMPVRLVIDTEPHADHTTGHYVFSPPAIVVAAAGAGESMRGADRSAPDRIQRLAATSPEMKAALDGYRFIAPQIEYHDAMTISLGGRVIELRYLKGVHSEADSAVWLPNERVLFSASAFVVNQINILRPFVTIPDILAAGKMMKALNPEHVVPGHGTPGTAKIFADGEQYYALLMDRVGKLMKEGKSLDDIKKEVKMPEYAGWGSQERFPTNVDAAYRALAAK
jgi:cyclase